MREKDNTCKNIINKVKVNPEYHPGNSSYSMCDKEDLQTHYTVSSLLSSSDETMGDDAEHQYFL